MLKQEKWKCISVYFFELKFQVSNAFPCIMHHTFINSSKLILPSWSRSPVAIRFSVISLTLYPGRGKQAALNRSFNSLQLIYPFPSVSVRQMTNRSFRAIQLIA